MTERIVTYDRHGGRTRFTVQGKGPVSVSVADVSTGVTALAEVRP